MQHLIQSSTNAFYLGDSLQKAYGRIDYEIDDKNRLVVTHTYVDPLYRGQGLANLLLNEIIHLATKNKQYIVPRCSFAYKVLHASSEYQPLLDPDENEVGPDPCLWKPK